MIIFYFEFILKYKQEN